AACWVEDRGLMHHANKGQMSPVAHHHMHMDHGHAGNGHAAMVTDFRNRFWISMILTVPILALSPLVQDLLGLRERLASRGESYVLFWSFCVVYLYSSWPFIKGMHDVLTGAPARHDDANCGRHFDRLFLFERGSLRSPCHGVLLGANDAGRRHAPWTLA